MAKREIPTSALSSKHTKTSLALRCYERPGSKQLRLSLGSSGDLTASASDLQLQKSMHISEQAIAAYRLTLQGQSPKSQNRHTRLTQSVFADTPKSRALLLGQKPITHIPIALTPKTVLKSQSQKALETAAFLAGQSTLPKPRRKAPSLVPKPIIVKKSGSVTPSGSITPNDFPSCRPVTATSAYASVLSTPKSRTPRQFLIPLGRTEKLEEVVTQVKSDPGTDMLSHAALYREHLFQTFQALKFIKSLPQADLSQISSKRVALPRRKGYENRKTIVFDLDETLVHCVEGLVGKAVDVVLPVTFPSGEVVKVRDM